MLIGSGSNFSVIMLRMKRTATAFLLATLFISSAFAQVRESSGGGASAAGGAGRAYEAAGKSAAARGLQQKMNSTLLRAIAKEKLATSRRTATKASKRPVAVRNEPSANSGAYFKPEAGADSNTFEFIANSIGSNADEKAIFKKLFEATKEGFEKEVAAKGRSNNITAAFTLFIATSLTVYHDDNEPSDEALDVLWDGLGSALGETSELTKLSNAEKQQIYDTLIAFSGLLLAGYVEGKNAGNDETAATFKKLAGVLFETVLKTDPDTLRFTATGLETIK